ncbi:dihydrofolate reductase [Corallococcus sp. H22C18031201]|nr:dihydrofolate reductase [Corallococcus sp. H22C18031201]
MSRVFFDVTVSLDGYLAGPNRGPDNPIGGRGPMLHAWLFSQRAFRQLLHLGDGGETGVDNQHVEETFQRIGANVMGKRMFEEGEHHWPEEAPFHSPVFVVTHEVRAPWVRKGGTTFYFVNDGLEEAVRRARGAAGSKDVRISGGANLIVQSLNAGLVDEFNLTVAPCFLGTGLRLFDGLDADRLWLELVDTLPSPRASHLRYTVRRK